MTHRILPALALLALAACQPYSAGPSSVGVDSYAPQRGPVLAGGETASHAGKDYAPFSPAQAPAYGAPAATPAVFTPTPSAKPPPDAPGGVFRDIDIHGGEVGFWNEDPVAKREAATYADRYVERITLRNGGVITYEMLNHGTFSDESDADLLKADLSLPPFRARGLSFDPATVERFGPFTYLAPSSADYNCFLFRGKFGVSGAPMEEAYGNICYAAQARDIASIKAEMLDLLAHARFGGRAGATVADATPEATKTAAGAARPVTVDLDRCRYAVSFSAAPAAAQKGGSTYRYAEGSYSEEARCACKPDADYAKLSQFDAVDAVRHLAEARGFKLQKATFGETPELGRELTFEAVADKGAGEAFLLGRSFYGKCGFSVLTTGVSYAELRKGRKFVASVAAAPAPEASAAAPDAVSDATVTNAAGPNGQQADAAPQAVPATPVTATDAAPAAVPDAKLAEAAKQGDEAASGGGSGSTVPPQAAQPVAADEAVQRLRRLKLLLDQKLITPDEYDAKRQAILKTL